MVQNLVSVVLRLTFETQLEGRSSFAIIESSKADGLDYFGCKDALAYAQCTKTVDQPDVTEVTLKDP